MGNENYYDLNAETFIHTTLSVDMGRLYNRFEKYLPSGASILDAGCGPGRDIKYFTGKGYKVSGFDSSEEMVNAANNYNGSCVVKMEFNQMTYREEFNGIWACASLLHVQKCEMNLVFNNIIKALKHNGVWYLSFKYGNIEREKEGRFFNDYTFTTLTEELNLLNDIKIIEMWTDNDIRAGSENKWINAIIRKIE